jgi:MSHA pilin protein MshC
MGRSVRRGFTQVELIVTIAITGILAAVAVPRFVSRDTFESRGFYDQAMAVVRHAQKTAIAWRRTIFVCVGANSISVGTVAGCGAPVSDPTDRSASPVPLAAGPAPSGVILSPTGDFSFDAIGRPSAAKTIIFSSTVSGDPARQIVVEAETGYVHP